MTQGSSPLLDAPARTGRELASRVVRRVLADHAWAAPTLDAELDRARLSSGERGRATDLTYGVLRALPTLEAEIDRHRPRRDPIEPFTRASLLTGAYELLYTTEKPWAIVDETVGLVRRARGEGLSRFVNAVLRKIARARPSDPRRPERLAVEGWLERLLEEDLGPERARAFLGERPLPPPLALRARVAREALAASIRDARPAADVALGALSSDAVLVRGAGDPRRLRSYERGDFVVMDESSQLVVQALDPRPGERVLDACAGRGGKTLAILDAMRGARDGALYASDDHPEKLERMGDELDRLGHPRASVTRVGVDLSVGLGPLAAERFDRVLVDAPCTGLGTIHRRPEILLRVGPDDPARMGELQARIALSAAKLVRPGGLLVYAVCSPTRAEGARVVEALAREEGLVCLREPIGPALPDADGVVRLGPFVDPHKSADAFQIARLRRPS